MTITTFLITTTTTSAIIDCVAVVVTLVVIVGVVVSMVASVVVVVVLVAVEAIDANVSTATSAPKHPLATREHQSMDPQTHPWLIKAKMGTVDVHPSLHHQLG